MKNDSHRGHRVKLLCALCVLCGRIEKAEINFVWQLFVQQHLMLSAPAFSNNSVQLFTKNSFCARIPCPGNEHPAPYRGSQVFGYGVLHVLRVLSHSIDRWPE